MVRSWVMKLGFIFLALSLGPLAAGQPLGSDEFDDDPLVFSADIPTEDPNGMEDEELLRFVAEAKTCLDEYYEGAGAECIVNLENPAEARVDEACYMEYSKQYYACVQEAKKHN